MKKLFIYLYILLLSVIPRIYGQNKDFNFDYFGVEDGLSQSDVYCVFQDSRGLIWIGTQAGLNRFDGRTFISYDADPIDKTSISSGWIHAIDEDPYGNLWIGTKNGLNKFNPKTEKFTHYLISDEDKKQIDGNNSVYSVLVDGKDAIWIKTNYTISKFIPSEERFEHHHHQHDEFTKLKTEFSLPMVKTNEGIWAGSSFGLQFLSFENMMIQTFVHDPNKPNTSIPSDYVISLTKDNSGNLYIGTDNGMAYFLPFYKKIRASVTLELNTLLETENIHTITGIVANEDGDNRMLILSTFNGIVNFDLNRRTYKIFREDKTNPESLKYNRIRSLFHDKSGNYWVGLNTKGLNKYSPKGDKFKTYRNSGNSGVQISDNVIAAVYSNDKEIWVGTWSKGISIINRKTNSVKIINTFGEKNKRIVDNHVHALYKDKNNIIWIGTKNGISIYSQKTDIFFSFKRYFGVDLPNSVLKTRINIIKRINEDIIAIGSANGLGNGLIFFNTLTKEFISPTTKDKKKFPLPETVYDILVYPDYFWVSTIHGLYKFNNNYEIDTVYIASNNLVKNTDGEYNSLNSSSIFDLEKDNDGYIWVATDIGLNRFDPRKETFKYYTKKENLPDNTIYELLLNNNDLWFSTNRGIVALNVVTDSIKTYNNSDGLQGLEFNNGASYKNESGEFFFGGSNGLNQFYPDSIKPNTTKPITTLLDYSIVDKDTKTTTKSLFGIKRINMSWQDLSIRINFASLEFTNPERNQFKYKLMGIQNDEWQDLKTQNYVSFPALPPGDYELFVKGSNNDLIWGNETSIKIYVSPPFYANVWAYLIYILIVAIVIFQIWSKNKNKQRKANEEIRSKQLMNLKLEQQKEELDIQNTNMTDSINYAKYIQDAMLPSEYLFKKLLPNSFILYLTKDIVSGDFYWITQRKTKTFIAAVDCTGHGVPGAFMSIIGFDLLKNIVKERGVEDPAEILNQLNYGVSDTFRKSNEDSHSVRDGMDMSLCVIDHSKHTLEFSGAMNPLCLIREESISIIKGNRFSIGSFNDNESNKFETHTIKYLPGDTFYMFSDGYPDQFGGPFGKKFKHKRFLHMLLNIHHLSPSKQKTELQENFKNWKGQIEQVDDVLVIGFKL